MLDVNSVQTGLNAMGFYEPSRGNVQGANNRSLRKLNRKKKKRRRFLLWKTWQYSYSAITGSRHVCAVSRKLSSLRQGEIFPGNAQQPS